VAAEGLLKDGVKEAVKLEEVVKEAVTALA
jgi:hypothetical protein